MVAGNSLKVTAGPHYKEFMSIGWTTSSPTHMTYVCSGNVGNSGTRSKRCFDQVSRYGRGWTSSSDKQEMEDSYCIYRGGIQIVPRAGSLAAGKPV